ncbi:MAG: nitroreductase family deazaflavin-dependent oxidoreductase [Jatrophihabitantaceae bacterium]
MTEMADWNTQVIEEFRANKGELSGQFAGAPVALLHHVGRKSGKQFLAPTMFLADESDPRAIYVFASKAGAPTNPEWYYNITTAGTTSVEIGAETYQVTAEEVTGAERDRIYAEQAKRFPGFGEYAEKTEGIRTIPVLKLTRAN